MKAIEGAVLEPIEESVTFILILTHLSGSAWEQRKVVCTKLLMLQMEHGKSLCRCKLSCCRKCTTAQVFKGNEKYNTAGLKKNISMITLGLPRLCPL